MKKKIMILLIVLVSFLFIGKAAADDKVEDTCSASQLSELRTMAANVRISYVPAEEYEEIPKDPETGATKERKNYVYIKIYNMNSRMQIRYTVKGKRMNSVDGLVTSRDVDNDGVITLRQTALDENAEYEFNIMSVYGSCTDRTLRTVKMTVPKFNVYSELDICSDVPDYYLCLQYTTYNVDGATFYDRVEEYKTRLANQTIAGEENGNSNVINRTMSTISKYKYVIVGLIVAAGVVVTVIVVKRKKSEV